MLSAVDAAGAIGREHPIVFTARSILCPEGFDWHSNDSSLATGMALLAPNKAITVLADQELQQLRRLTIRSVSWTAARARYYLPSLQVTPYKSHMVWHRDCDVTSLQDRRYAYTDEPLTSNEQDDECNIHDALLFLKRGYTRLRFHITKSDAETRPAGRRITKNIENSPGTQHYHVRLRAAPDKPCAYCLAVLQCNQHRVRPKQPWRQ